MTEKEKEAIVFLKECKKEIKKMKPVEDIYRENNRYKHIQFILLEKDWDIFETLLNLIQKQDTEINKLKEENNTLKEQVQMFIPRRRVRRVYKMLGKILRTDIDPVLLEKELKSEERRGEYE